MIYRVELPNGDWAEAQTLEAAMLAVETLIEDSAKFLRDNVAIFRDGDLDASATSMAQSAGMLV